MKKKIKTICTKKNAVVFLQVIEAKFDGVELKKYTVDSRCLELGWLEFPVESNFYRSPELRCV